MIEEEYVKNKKIEEYNKALDELRRRQEIEKAEIIRRTILMRFLTKPARERLSRVRVAHPNLAAQFEISLFQAIQMNQVKEAITDEQVKDILKELTKAKKSINIIK